MDEDIKHESSEDDVAAAMGFSGFGMQPRNRQAQSHQQQKPLKRSTSKAMSFIRLLLLFPIAVVHALATFFYYAFSRSLSFIMSPEERLEIPPGTVIDEATVEHTEEPLQPDHEHGEIGIYFLLSLFSSLFTRVKNIQSLTSLSLHHIHNGKPLTSRQQSKTTAPRHRRLPTRTPIPPSAAEAVRSTFPDEPVQSQTLLTNPLIYPRPRHREQLHQCWHIPPRPQPRLLQQQSERHPARHDAIPL